MPIVTIRVVQADTDAVGYDAGVGGSRVTNTHGQAAQQLLVRLKELVGAENRPFLDVARRAVRATALPCGLSPPSKCVERTSPPSVHR